MTEINWESAYRTLEQQFEHTLIGVASALDEVERRAEASRRPTIHEVRTDVNEGGAEFVVSASGAYLEYSFVVRSGENALLTTPYGPKNSITFSPASFSGEIECDVSVRSTTAPERVVSKVTKSISFHLGRA